MKASFCITCFGAYTVGMEYELHGPEMMQPVAAEVIARAALVLQKEARACLCTLSGDLGAGKTTLTQWIGKELGIDQSIQSPTFVIRKRYETKDPVIKQLIHIDAYRLNSGEEIQKIRFSDDVQQQNTLMCLEWPEQIADLGLTPDIAITIKHAENGGRTVSIQP